jgi:hypothetical protein
MYPWNQLGRRVTKEEKGIRILAPIISQLPPLGKDGQHFSIGKGVGLR